VTGGAGPAYIEEERSSDGFLHADVMSARRLAVLPPQGVQSRRIPDELVNAAGESMRVARGNQALGRQQFGDTANRARDSREPSRHGFEKRPRQTLRQGRVHEHVGRIERSSHAGEIELSQEFHVSKAQVSRLTLEVRQEGPRTDDSKPDAATTLPQFTERAQQNRGAFVRLVQSCNRYQRERLGGPARRTVDIERAIVERYIGRSVGSSGRRILEL
jgi:hypothetical protein